MWIARSACLLPSKTCRKLMLKIYVRLPVGRWSFWTVRGWDSSAAATGGTLTGTTLATNLGLPRRDRIVCVVPGCNVLEKTAQVARHIRCIVLRRITEVAGYRRSNAGHGSCNMGIVCARSSHKQRTHSSLWHVTGHGRQVPSLPPSVQCWPPEHPIRDDKLGQPKLARSDWV